ncbi:MAG: four helix bundle protein [Candidatus Aenigmarchaeota archaeon]|nr:four helix bundle protein [Candidatus Aenigmarchaeota archaeon]
MTYTNLFHKSYELIRWIYPTMNKFPRNQRVILSQRIEVTSIRILELVIDLSESDTIVKRKKIKHELNKLQILFRLSKDLSYLNFKRYEYVSSLIAKISQLLDINQGGGAGNGLQKFIQ